MEQELYQLEMRNISKHFGNINALDDISLKVKMGEIHALVGENGAGKSTLIKILSGAYIRDTGEIYIKNAKVEISHPLDAKRLGIAVIYQEFMLAPDLTVAENIYIDRLSNGKSLINWKQLRSDAKRQLEELGFSDIPANAKVANLSVAHQQVVEICKCLSRQARILVLDEPTAVLTVNEISKLFKILKMLKEKGVSIIFISHHLNEIFELCDTVTVLKDGQVMGTLPVEAVDNNKLIHMMIGRELSQMFPVRKANIGDVVLKVTHLSSGTRVKDVSFEVRAGEILGFSGLVGSGRTEAMLSIFRADRQTLGEVYMNGKKVAFASPRSAIKCGLGYLSEDRKALGLMVNQSIRVNSTITILDKVTNKGFILRKKERDYVEDLLDRLVTKYESIEDNASSLSGGNQQKVALIKWLASDCKCMILDEPTRGVDVGAKVEIYNIISKLAEQGIAVIMISSEMPEIIGMCDRTVVMRLGYVTGELLRDELSEVNIMKLAMKAV